MSYEYREVFVDHETIHQRIAERGIEEVRVLAPTKLDRDIVETAYSIMCDDSLPIGYIHAGFAMSSLPHKETKEHTWIRLAGPGNKLRVESGLDQNEQYVGLPYGSTARMILLYLQTQAFSQKTREVELGKSMHTWLGTLGIPAGGKTYARVREQAKRLSLCRLTFFKVTSDETQVRNGSFVRDAILPPTRSLPDQGSLWRETVILDEAFYQSLIEHPLPVREAAIRALSGRSVAIDVYIWLSYRLHVLTKPTPVSWIALKEQFGHNYANLKGFKLEFQAPLKLALAAYDGAKVEINDRGVILFPSPPAVPPKQSSVGYTRLRTLDHAV